MSTDFSFLHLADLHLGSTFKALQNSLHGRELNFVQSTFEALDELIGIALSKRVDFVVISGDIFDHDAPSLKSRFHFLNAMKQLQQNSIKCFIAAGNHDPLNEWDDFLEELPDNVTVFPATAPAQAYFIYKDGQEAAVIYGISHNTAKEGKDLTLAFPQQRQELPAIGVLHCSIGNNPNHLAYAPTSVENLRKYAINYWALGHVHSFDFYEQNGNLIVYPGCIQGRSFHECGPKYACWVKYEAGNFAVEKISGARFIFLDLTVPISECDSLSSIYEQITLIFKQHVSVDHPSSGSYIVRINLKGRTRFNHELQNASTEELSQIIEESLNQHIQNPVILGALQLQTASDYDIDQLRNDNTFWSDIIKEGEALSREMDKDKLKELNLLSDKLRLFPPLSDRAQCQEIYDASIRRILDMLIPDEE